MKNWITKNGCQIRQVLDGRSNSFLILNKQKALLIDTGRRNKWETLINNIERLIINGYSLAALILTHTHFDHAENASSIKDKYKVPIIVHKNEADYLKNGESPLISGTFFITRLLTDLLGKKLQPSFKYESAAYDHLVDEKYDLEFLGFSAYIIHTPGHSCGSMSVIVDNEIAIVGDAMFGVFRGSVFPPFAEDLNLMIKSWGRLLDTNCSIFLPAHGTAVSWELLERQYNKYKKAASHL